MFERLASLPLEIEGYTLERLTGGERVTTLLRLQGRGEEGFGEDLLQMPGEADPIEVPADLPLAGSWTLESFLDALGGMNQWVEEPPEEWGDFAARLRNWVFESAALDLALRQAGVPLAAALGRDEPRPVTFVNSFGLGDPPALDRLRATIELYPTVGFKLDAAPTWTREVIAALAETGMVRTVDFKGHYGLEIEGDIAPVYEAVVELLPEALIEDPHEGVDGLPLERVSFDAPITRVQDIGDTRTINVKPSRIGSLRRLLEIYAWCEERGVAMYGGGMGELGPARRQIQLLAGLFHPDGPNDVAPPPFNLPDPAPGLPSSPLDVSGPPPGFRLK
ncbi:hypothetical protein DVA67_005920 [Solirubrobacter sp. CPCC 204708]|nr:hypothetical protein [Solirubrobacter deserti]